MNIEGHRMSMAIRTAPLALLTLLTACSGGLPDLKAGSTTVVEHTATGTSLGIPEGATLRAPPGKNLTLTVDGVETAIAPGTHRGKIVLAVTDDIPVKYLELDPHHFRAALYVNDGRIVPEKSVTSALVGGRYDDASASNVAITSNDENFNGIYVTGNSKYTISSPSIRFTGNGGNDFAGFGAAIMVTGHADVTVDHASIVTQGAVRTAVFAGDDATVHMNDCNIEVRNGTLPASYVWNVDLGKMMEVPWMLGLSGNVRATNAVDRATVYYDHCHLKSQGWGVLSTDATRHVRMFVTHSTIETTESGYGAYSIGDAVDSFSDTTFNVADVGLIIGAEGSAIFTDASVVNSGRFGVMMHTGVGGGTLTIEKGSVFNTMSTAIQVKGRGTTIVVDNAQLKAGNGILVEAMANDDPFLKKMMAAGPPPGGAPPPAAPGGTSGSAANVGAVAGAAAAALSPDVVATLRNGSYQGDLINARVDQGDMAVTLDQVSLRGAITAAVATPVGDEPTEQTRKLIGDVKNRFGPSADPKNGARVTVGGSSTWTVTQTSYLTGLALADGARVVAPEGKRIALVVNGRSTPVRAGRYAGRIEVRVN